MKAPPTMSFDGMPLQTLRELMVKVAFGKKNQTRMGTMVVAYDTKVKDATRREAISELLAMIDGYVAADRCDPAIQGEIATLFLTAKPDDSDVAHKAAEALAHHFDAQAKVIADLRRDLMERDASLGVSLEDAPLAIGGVPLKMSDDVPVGMLLANPKTFRPASSPDEDAASIDQRVAAIAEAMASAATAATEDVEGAVGVLPGRATGSVPTDAEGGE